MSSAVGGVYGTFAELVAVDPVVLLAADVNAGAFVSWTITLNPYHRGSVAVVRAGHGCRRI